MRKIIHRVLLTLGYRTLWLANLIAPGGRAAKEKLAAERVGIWYADALNQRRLYDFPLQEGALVFDVGGFEGDWTAEMIMRTGCRSEVFEAVPAFAEKIRERFDFTDRVVVHDFGLGGRDARVPISVDAARSSLVYGSEATATTEAQIRDVVAYLGERQISVVHVLKLNIEGAEFDLLERVLDADRATAFEHVLVQFHDEVPDAAERVSAISERLARTHELLWRFEFVWECWRRRAQPAATDDAVHA